MLQSSAKGKMLRKLNVIKNKDLSRSTTASKTGNTTYKSGVGISDMTANDYTYSCCGAKPTSKKCLKCSMCFRKYHLMCLKKYYNFGLADIKLYESGEILWTCYVCVRIQLEQSATNIYGNAKRRRVTLVGI